MFESVNPFNGEVVATYEAMSTEETASTIERVAEAQEVWTEVALSERAKHMQAAARVLCEERERWAMLMTLEMGKPITEARSEVEKCAWVCNYYAEHADAFLSPELIESDAAKSFVTYQPLGVVLAVMPWNFPFWQVFRFAAPGLMAGNGAVLKHASNVMGSALAIEEVFQRAGFPEHLFRTLLIGSDGVNGVLENPHIRAATLTGSGPAGRAVAEKAGSELKKTVLELGGSDPYILLADADLDLAVAKCVESRLINSGQSCIAAKRFIVLREQLEELERRFTAEMESRTMGDPMDDETDIGPQARTDLRDELHQQVQRSVEAGARCLLGGTVPEGRGAFYPPTLLTDVAPDMPAYDEELFGPVAALIPVDDEDEAIRVANDTNFGLGAAVFTRDRARGERIAAQQLEAGCCFVNDFVRSDPRLPFGGIKESGYGRELSHLGIREFVNTKTVYIAE